MKTVVVLFLSGIIISSCNSGTSQIRATENNHSNPDETAIKKAVDDAYAAISFKNGAKPNYDSIKYAFIPQAQLIEFITDTAQILSIDNFVKAFKTYVDSSKIETFYETELYGRTDQYGNIAQRISSYKTYINSSDIVKERGVNSLQLIKTPQGWKVSSIIWNVEKPSLPIPDYYLDKK
jgi:hypothetical protein